MNSVKEDLKWKKTFSHSTFKWRNTFEINLAISVRVENVDHSLHQRILLQLGQRHEFVDAESTGIVQIQFAESLSQPFDLVRVDWKTNKKELEKNYKDKKWQTYRWNTSQVAKKHRFPV